MDEAQGRSSRLVTRQDRLGRVIADMVSSAVMLLGLTTCGHRAPTTPPVVAQEPIADTTMVVDTADRKDGSGMKEAGPIPVGTKKVVPVPNEEGCTDHIEASGGTVRITTYGSSVPNGDKQVDLAADLDAAWQLAEQAAGRSIADDFEQGISTEHLDMPDTIDVVFMRYRNCHVRSPDRTEYYKVWRSSDRTCAWRGPL